MTESHRHAIESVEYLSRVIGSLDHASNYIDIGDTLAYYKQQYRDAIKELKKYQEVSSWY